MSPTVACFETEKLLWKEHHTDKPDFHLARVRKPMLGWNSFLFGALNFFCLPFVWAFYPETSCRSLESIDELFEGSSAMIAFDKRLTCVARDELKEKMDA